jgi:hypothetical protein
VATGVAGGVLDQDQRALAQVGLATGTVRAKVTELDATQAETLALRERLTGQEAAIGRLLADRKAMLATARAEVRAQIRAEQARQEYVGQGLMVHAPHTGALVRVDALRPSGYAGATRPGKAAKA